jgi:Spy/CpxP family protein refolding chaperone
VKVPLKSALVTIALAVIAGIVGVWLGGQIFATSPAHGNSLHAMVHKELSLSSQQKGDLDAIEMSFAERRRTLEGEMREANAELAAAIRASESAGPQVEAAVRHFHDAMGALQTETIEHVFAMRKVLTAEQRKRFDDKIAQALTSDAE